MSETKQLISDLDAKVDVLIKKLTDVNVNSDKQKEEIEDLTKKLAEKNLLVSKLEKEKVSIEVKDTVEESDDKEQINVRINELVKEIDNCISLLKV